MPPGGRPPKKKSRVGCVVAAILVAIPVVLIAVTVGGYFFLRHQHVAEPAGQEAAAVDQPPECDLISAATLRELHTTNFISGTVSEDTGAVNCMWVPLKGKDGSNERKVSIYVSAAVSEDEPIAEAEESFAYNRQTESDAQRITDVQGPWDEAFLAGNTSTAEGMLVFRKGTKVISVSYDGTDKSYGFEDVAMPIDEAEQGARKIALEIAPKL